ncbi:hypothetical protein JX266_001869 [Neoarthrinium moseri]|nr:hypothetical protein JX266_001869 [Neoarthrinium moseri]
MLSSAAMVLPALAVRQLGNSHFPCPNGNNTQIGDIQKFNVLCGVDIGGIEIDRMQVDSLSTCAGICTSHQNPRCDGVTFRLDNTCIFKSDLSGAQIKAASGADSARGIMPNPPPTSGCSSLGTGNIEFVQAKNFNLQCAQVFVGNDIEQQFQPSFEACLNACANMTACGGISFDLTQSAGFKNCYLKTEITTGGLLAKANIDSAFVSVNNAAANPSSQASGGFVTQSSAPASAASSTTTATSQPAGATTVMMTTVSVPASFEEATSTPSSIPIATVAPVPADTAASSNAWIAAPVIGGLAAVTLILGIFILWGRRRRSGGRSLPFAGGFGGRLPHGRAFFGGEKLVDEEATRVRSSVSSRGLDSAMSGVAKSGASGGIKVLSGSGRRVGHETMTAGTGPGLDDMVGLRDSQNGLKLNGVSVHSANRESVPGIPGAFAGPETK